jgi:hypothetical protein
MDAEPVVDPAAQSRRHEVREFSPLAVGILTLSVMLLYFWLSGALFPENTTGYAMSAARATGMALTYATTPAFILAALFFSQRRTRAMLDQLANSGNVSREAATSCGAVGMAIGPARNVAATILGLALGSTQITWPRLVEDLGEPTIFLAISIAIGNLVTWIAVAHVLLRRIIASNSIRRLGRDDIKVDLLRLDTLLPFGRIGTLHVLIVVIAVSLSAFQSLDAELRWVNYSSALAAGIFGGLVLTLLPMIGIRQNVRRAKHRALESLDQAILHADRDLEPDPLRYLGDLLQLRETIVHAREWPLGTTGVSRIAIYFIIPPIAWVGSALVEILLQAAL